MKYFLYTIALAIILLPQTVLANTNLAVPFTSQAPFGNWQQPWQDACEEAVITMVDTYYNTPQQLLDRDTAKKKIEDIFTIKETFFKASLDEDANTMAALINNFLPWEARVVESPTIWQIKHEIDQKRPVILPTYGKALYNPYFRSGGPNYHTIVISGYDDLTQEFITQEPGTSSGANYRYSYKRLIEAMHDFVPGRHSENGRKVAIFTQKNSEQSNSSDGDKDGLLKEKELLLGTSLSKIDTDDDGHSDAVEVEYGYSPIVNERILGKGSLVKSGNDPKVYLLSTNKKHHILTEEVFLRHNWHWAEIVQVSDMFLSHFERGEDVSR